MPLSSKVRALFVALTLTLGCIVLFAAGAAAQTATTGSVSGTITDATGAVLPGASVVLTNLGTGATTTTKSNKAGDFQFGLLQPASYKLAVSARGFRTTVATVAVQVSVNTTANLRLAVGAAEQSVTVSSEAPLVQTNNGNITTSFSQRQIELDPNPGNDLTAIAQTSPGVVMNTQMGYGNFETFGLSATANLFTLNGMDDNDPFLNLNNSGATNLVLGKNEVQEQTVVSNGYSGQYGRLMGSSINTTTLSGTNQWHGDAIYNWNGRAMNANNFFNNAQGTGPNGKDLVPRPFVNANQWAWRVGGPILHNKTFFFVDNEALDVVIPTNSPVNVPSPAFEAAATANIAANAPGESAMYASMFKLWNNAAGAANAADILPPGTDKNGNATGDGCGSFNLLPASSPCALQFRSTAGNYTHEWMLSARVDQNFSDNDRVFFRFRTDHGDQATYTDPINPVFNAYSIQPEYEGQLEYTHATGGGAINNFGLSAMHYVAAFNNLNHAASLAVFPTDLGFSGGAFASLGGDLADWPQGRYVGQIQATDDYTKTFGANTLSFGGDIRRDKSDDYDFGEITSGDTFGFETLSDFYAGNMTLYEQAFPKSGNQGIVAYNLGLYLEDEWAAAPNLKLTVSLRADHNSDPVCSAKCFALPAQSFEQMSHNAATPYNATIQTGLSRAVNQYEAWGWQPRVGFAYTPGGSQQTVVRGGVGLFDDSFPVTLADSAGENPPYENYFVVGGVPLFGPGGAAASAATNNAAFVAGFNSGATLAAIEQAAPAFSPPNLFTENGRVMLPRAMEWNLEVQRRFYANDVVTLNYVGNHAAHEMFENAGLNAYCPASACPGGFAGLPAAPADPRFNTVTELSTNAVSNYNGLVASYVHRFSSGFQIAANYTWSHALDEVSNGGLLPFSYTGNYESVLHPQDPFNPGKYNYGNADYDVRHDFNANYMWDAPFARWFPSAPKVLAAGWRVAGTIFTRSGLPFTATDSGATGTLSNYGYGATVFANELSGLESNCGPNGPCVSPTEFSASTTSPTAFGNQIRNQFRGPRYFDTDMTLEKDTPLPKWENANLSFAFEFFNLFNHPNFDLPVTDVANPQFGTVTGTVGPPTSVVGSFLGGDSSPRMIQFTTKLTF